eukprot:g4737.t1
MSYKGEVHKNGINREAMNPSVRISMIPLRHTKIVHFIRHAQGFHNVAGEANPTEYMNPKFHDAHLTSQGWQQVYRLRTHFSEIKPVFRVDLVIVSPLTRTLETACGLFGNLYPENDEEPLMLGRDTIEGMRPGRGLIAKSSQALPILATETCRERIDIHPCDKRRSRSYYQLNFPGVDFSQVQADEDPFPSGTAESDQQFIERTHEFLRLINSRAESHIAVVSHGGFLRGLCRQFGLSFGTGVRSHLHGFFANCEMRSMVLADQHGDLNANCEVSHPGGTTTTTTTTGIQDST